MKATFSVKPATLDERRTTRRRLTTLKRWLNYSSVTVLALTCLVAQTSARVQTFPLTDTTGLVAPKLVKMEAGQYQGRKCVRITMEGNDHEGLALLPGTHMA